MKNAPSSNALRSGLRATRARERKLRAVAMAAHTFCGVAMLSVVAGVSLLWKGAAWTDDATQLKGWHFAVFSLPWVSMTLAAVIGWLRPLRYAQLAQMVDERCRLQDRVQTAWCFASESLAPSEDAGARNTLTAQEATLCGLKRLQVDDAIQQLRRVDPRQVVPWSFSRLWIVGVLFWLISLGILRVGGDAVAQLAHRTERQRSQDEVNQSLAEQLENTLLRDLKKLAELTEMQPQENVALRELAQNVEQQLEKLKRDGVTREESLATISQIQAAITRASGKFDTGQIESQMRDLAQTMAAAESLESVAEAIDQQDYQQAAQNLEQADPRQLADLERQTLADELEKSAGAMKNEQLNDLASVTEAWQEAMTQNDQAAMSTAAQQMAAQMRQQASRMAIEAELQEQLASLAEAKGTSRSGGSNIDPSQEDRSTYGRGKAGDPTAEEEAALATTRQREELQGTAGEGPSERETMPSESTEIVTTREYQAKYDQYQRMAETALRHESLPLGHRRTIRKYFESLRP